MARRIACAGHAGEERDDRGKRSWCVIASDARLCPRHEDRVSCAWAHLSCSQRRSAAVLLRCTVSHPQSSDRHLHELPCSQGMIVLAEDAGCLFAPDDDCRTPPQRRPLADLLRSAPPQTRCSTRAPVRRRQPDRTCRRTTCSHSHLIRQPREAGGCAPVYRQRWMALDRRLSPRRTPVCGWLSCRCLRLRWCDPNTILLCITQARRIAACDVFIGCCRLLYSRWPSHAFAFL